MQSSLSLLTNVLRPWIVRGPLLVATSIGIYDGVSSQMDWPKIPALWGMTGSLLPWWGWLLILQAILVGGLFEYVSRNLPAAHRHTPTSSIDVVYDDSKIREEIRIIEGAFNDALSELEAKIKPMEYIAGKIILDERRKLAEYVKSAIESWRSEKPDTSMTFHQNLDFPGTYRGLADACRDLELFEDANREIERVSAQIIADAKYLMPDTQFADGERKRAWALRNARLDAFEHALEAKGFIRTAK